MRTTLKDHTLPALLHDLQSLEFERREQIITEEFYTHRLGKLTAEIARRNKTKTR